MPRMKNESGSEHSVDADDAQAVRRRVVKACQRCRLKKCKCDGSTPCTRCKSDDAICAYGKHKKSDKIIFRKGYVQMLERQHAQLTTGLQELYRRTQNGVGWTARPLDLVNDGQPLTHKILEGLGVLSADEWDEEEGVVGWTGFEQQQGGGGGESVGIMRQQDHPDFNNHSETASPANTTSPETGLSPVEVAPMAFSQSAIMARRRERGGGQRVGGGQGLAMAQGGGFGSFAAEDGLKALPPFTHDPGFADGSAGFGGEMEQLQIPPPPLQLFGHGGLPDGDGLGFVGGMEWGLGMGTDEMFDMSGGQGGLSLQVVG